MEKQHRFEVIAATALVLVTGVLIYAGLQWRSSVPSHANRYQLVFNSAIGVSPDHPVTIAGVAIGVVEKVELDHGVAKVQIAIKPEVKLYNDALAQIKTKSLLGEKYIELTAGNPSTAALAPGSILSNTISAPDLDEVFGQGQVVLAKALRMVDSIETQAEARLNLLDKTLHRTHSLIEKADKEMPDVFKQIKISMKAAQDLMGDHKLEQAQRLLGKLESLLNKADAIDEKTIRKFQLEGMRVRLFSIPDVEARIRELDKAEAQAKIQAEQVQAAIP